MPTSIPVFKPTIKRRDMDSVLSCLVSESIGAGELAGTLTKQLAAYLGTAGGFAVRDYLRAVEFALDAIGLEPGVPVVISPLAPNTYANALTKRGAEILTPDVDPDTACLDPSSVEKCLAKSPALILSYSPLGFVPDLQRLEAFGVPVVEDISTCIGSYALERKNGACGRYVVISLEPQQIITSGGGAAVLSRSTRDVGNLRRAVGEVPSALLMSDMNAALALTQLKHIDEFVERRGEIAKHYYEALRRSRHRSVSAGGDGAPVHSSFPVLVEGSVKEAVRYAKSKGVGTASAFEDAVVHALDGAAETCPTALGLAMRCIEFPLYPMLASQDVQRIARVLSTLP